MRRMRWTVHGERRLYDSDWVALALADVEQPGGRRFDHHVLRMPRPAVGVVVADPARGVLLLHRHRFITDTWGWEIPAGGVDAGEDLEAAAHRETLEETGWAPSPLTHLAAYHPTNGISDFTFHLYAAAGATHAGDPTDPFESDRIAWVGLDDLRSLIRAGEVTDGMSLTALTYWLTFGPGGPQPSSTTVPTES